jgi:hypothetical protein
MATERPTTKRGQLASSDAPRPQRVTHLRLACETTGQRIEHEVPSDVGTLRDLWDRKLELTCPHCGQVHRFSFRTAFIEGALATGSLEALAAVNRSRDEA